MRPNRMSFLGAACAIPVLIFAACFPDFQIGPAADDAGNGADGTSSDGAAGDTASPDGGARDASGTDAPLGDGGVADGDAPFDAADMKLVPRGTFVFHDPTSSGSTTSTLTHDLYMDTHELTVGAFRQWVAAAKPVPSCADAGPCSLDPGGPYERTMAWDPSWNVYVADVKYKDDLCQTGYSFFIENYTTYNQSDDTVPINCVNWYQAAALCYWMGGKRLPTQVEWQYEASGRGADRTFPWGDTPVPTDCTLAIWQDNVGSGGNPPFNGCKFPKPIGSAPLGASRDGVEDMAGSVAEWTWDWYDNTYPSSWPPDWTGPASDAGVSSKMVRGGAWEVYDPDLRTNQIGTHSPQSAFNDVGVRCVRTKL